MINTKLLQASREMLRWADKGDYRPEYAAAVSQLQQAVFDADQAMHERRPDGLLTTGALLARNAAELFVPNTMSTTVETSDAAIAKATGAQS